MNLFDEDYMARREKQIKELYELRAMIVACLVTGVVLALISAGLLSAGYRTLGAILLAIALLFGVGSLFMIASYFAEKGADKPSRGNTTCWRSIASPSAAARKTQSL